jgi:hypothetical protein
VVGRLWGRSPEHVSQQRPWCAGGRASRRVWCARAGRSVAALNRRATSWFGARRWTVPWFGASGRHVRKGNRRTDGPARHSLWPVRRGARPGAWLEGGWTPRRLGARDGLGKARAGAGAEAAGDVAAWRGAASAGRNCVIVSLFEHVKFQKVE